MRSVRLRPRTTYNPCWRYAGKEHVHRTQGHPCGNRDGLFTGGLHIERDASLTLNLLHAVIECAGQHHVPQCDLQLRRVQVRIPGTDRTVVVI